MFDTRGGHLNNFYRIVILLITTQPTSLLLLSVVYFRCTVMLMRRSCIFTISLHHETKLQRLRECITDIETWMSSNRLQMNADKTQ